MATPKAAPATAPADDLDPRPGIAWPAGTTWWGDMLPSRPDPASDGIRYTGWWDRARTLALVSWLGDGSTNDLARVLAGSPADRIEYARRRSRAAWVADQMAGREPKIGTVRDLLAWPLPQDRERRARQGAARLDRVAEIVPTMGRGDARGLFQHRHVVDAISEANLWPILSDPRRLRTGRVDAHGDPIVMSIIPEPVRRIDHDARMLAAEGVFDG